MACVGAFIAIFIASVTAWGAKDVSWLLSWEPPVLVTKRDRLGKSVDEILKMRFDKWEAFASAAREKRERLGGADGEDPPMAFARDGINEVWSSCVKDRNDAILAGLPSDQRARYESLRKHLLHFGLDCVALEHVLGIGSTVASHEPPILWGEEETVLFVILKHKAVRSLDGDSQDRIHNRIAKYKTLNKIPQEGFERPDTDLREIHKSAAKAEEELKAVNTLMRPLSEAQKRVVLRYESDYLVRYIEGRIDWHNAWTGVN